MILFDNSINFWHIVTLIIFIISLSFLLLSLKFFNRLGVFFRHQHRKVVPLKLSEQLILDENESLFLQHLCADLHHRHLQDWQSLDGILFQAYQQQMKNQEAGQTANDEELALIFSIYGKKLAHAPAPVSILNTGRWSVNQLVMVSPVSADQQATPFFLQRHIDHDVMEFFSPHQPKWPTADRLTVSIAHAGSGAVFTAHQQSLQQRDGLWELRLQGVQYHRALSQKKLWPPLQYSYEQVVEVSFVRKTATVKTVAKSEVLMRQLSEKNCLLALNCPPQPFDLVVLKLFLEYDRAASAVAVTPQSWQPLLPDGQINYQVKPLPGNYRPAAGQAWLLSADIHPATSLAEKNRIAALVYQFYQRNYSKNKNTKDEIPHLNLNDLKDNKNFN